MSGHTPGPWAVFHDHQDPATARSLGYVRREADDMGWAAPWGFPCIASCFGCEHPEQEANARLIAAAPELLEALLDAREQLRAYEQDASGEDYNSPSINAAIAKATGASA
jgi:hypothetical protein